MLSIVLFFIFTGSLFSEDIQYQKGEQIYFSHGCPNCHGLKAKGLHSYPSLANRSKWDLKRRLLKLRNGIENNQQSLIMIPFARNLSNSEIDNLSYFLEQIYTKKDEPIYEIEYESWGDGGS